MSPSEWTPAQRQALLDMASRIEVAPYELVKVLNSESGMNWHANGWSTGMYGLIQRSAAISFNEAVPGFGVAIVLTDGEAKSGLRGNFEESLSATETHLSYILSRSESLGLKRNAQTIHVGLAGEGSLQRLGERAQHTSSFDNVVVFSSRLALDGGNGPASPADVRNYKGNKGIDLKHGNGDGTVTVGELSAFQEASFDHRKGKQWKDWLNDPTSVAINRAANEPTGSMTDADWEKASR